MNECVDFIFTQLLVYLWKFLQTFRYEENFYVTSCLREWNFNFNTNVKQFFGYNLSLFVSVRFKAKLTWKNYYPLGTEFRKP